MLWQLFLARNFSRKKVLNIPLEAKGTIQRRIYQNRRLPVLLGGKMRSFSRVKLSEPVIYIEKASDIYQRLCFSK